MSDTAHSERGLYLAIECGSKEWKLAFGTEKARRQVTITAGDVEGLRAQMRRAKERMGLAAEAGVYSCYEAGRDGFCIHRMLTEALGVRNVVVDPASIEVRRGGKRVKTDRLDARKLLEMLLRYWVYGERKSWSVLHVPDEAQEAARRPHRERDRLVKERTAHRTRIKSLMALYGVRGHRLPKTVGLVRDWRGHPLPAELEAEVDREVRRLEVVEKQLAELHALRKAAKVSGSVQRANRLAQIKGVGAQTGWNLAHEFFWRDFRNRREVGSAAGLVGCPYDSGESRREQGISKAGNARVRMWMTEMAWRWLRYQPGSALARWYQVRFAHGSGRMRRIGIVALARKLLVALWKYLTYDLVPEGATVNA